MFYENIYDKKNPKSLEEIASISVNCAKFIYDTKDELLNKLASLEMLNLFNDIELPLSLVLADMEYTGINVDKSKLNIGNVGYYVLDITTDGPMSFDIK